MVFVYDKDFVFEVYLPALNGAGSRQTVYDNTLMMVLLIEGA